MPFGWERRRLLAAARGDSVSLSDRGNRGQTKSGSAVYMECRLKLVAPDLSAFHGKPKADEVSADAARAAPERRSEVVSENWREPRTCVAKLVNMGGNQ